MIHPSQIWHWLLNGLHGLIDMLAHKEAVTMNADQRKRLKDAIDRLTALHQKLENQANG